MHGMNVKKKKKVKKWGVGGWKARINALPDDGISATLKHVGAVLM